MKFVEHGIPRFNRIDTNFALLVIKNQRIAAAGMPGGSTDPLNVLFFVGAGKRALPETRPRRNHFPNSLSVAVMRPMVGFAAQYSFSLFKLSVNVLVSIIGGS